MATLQDKLNTGTDQPQHGVSRLVQGTEMPDTLALNTALHRTIELEALLQIFSAEIQAMVPHKALHYENAERELSYETQRADRHRCSYRLSLLENQLGELSLSRGRPFSEEDLARFEYLICALVYPLRNALLYHDALSAALRDPLTGVGNRGALDSSLEREVQLAHRQETPLSLLTIDIDHFKRINDEHGHPVGDCVLQSVAAALTNAVRASDLVYRYGGEEFVVLLTNTAAKDAQMVAERIREAVAESDYECEGHAIQSTISIGVAALKPRETGESLFERADDALYEAKHSGRNRVCLFD